MLRDVALLVAVVSLGCSSAYDDPCRACRAWEECRAGECALKAESRWDVVAVAGEVSATAPSGRSWDAEGGAPDPFVCLVVGSTETCTDAATDNFTPAWNAVVAGDVDVGPLLAGVRMRFADDDDASSETICSGTVPVSPDAFRGGGFTLTCQAGAGRVAFELRHRTEP